MGEAILTRRGGGKPKLKSIAVTAPPNKTSYIAGETFDAAGMTVTADIGWLTFEAGGYTISPMVMTAGTTAVTITYEFAGATKTTTQPVTVKTLSSIAITTQPTKRAYKFGEVFDRAGMVVTATYSDGSTADVTAQAAHTPIGALTHADTTVTVSLTVGGTTKTATTTITIAKVLTGIEITTPPTVTQYIVDQTITMAGMVVRATYSDTSTATVTGSCTNNPTTAAVGTTFYTVSYTYDGAIKTVNQAISVVTPSATLNANSWETISLVAAAGMAQTYWETGDETTVQMDGTNYAVRIIDFNHDDLDTSDPRYNDATYNGGTKKAAITFEFKECYGTTYRMHSSDNNAVSWQGCEMRTATVPTLIGQLPAALQSALRTVKKLTAQSGISSTILTTVDKLWPLSEVEVLGTNENSKAGEGTRYAFYTAGNSRIKYLSGSVTWWWLRSPYSGASTAFLIVYIDGSTAYYGASSTGTGGGVVFGFCI